MNKSKLWSICLLGLTALLLISAGAATAVIDPFFHYHAPLKALEYPLNNQRYQNDGIVKHFDYDGLITGTSLTENFRASEFDALFGVDSVKVCFSGGTYEEITSNLKNALAANPDIRYVIYGIDEWFLFSGRELILADGEYPTYLYDENLFNDVKYLLNKEVLCSNTLGVLDYTAQGLTTTTFDQYSSWSPETGAAVILPGYDRPEQSEKVQDFTPAMAKNLTANLQQNLVQLAKDYPDTQFLYFFPPYSILNWDIHQQEGKTQQIIDGFALATQILLEAPNIQVYSFYTDFALCTELDNYSDVVHYSSRINSLLLQRMRNGEYRLTEENRKQHWQAVADFYLNFDYDGFIADHS